MVRFGGTRMEGIFQTLGVADTKIESNVITKSISSAQRRVEGYNFDIRKTLLEYDDVLRQQREIIYEQRNMILDNDDVHDIILGMFKQTMDNVVNTNMESGSRTNVDFEGLAHGLETLGVPVTESYINTLRNLDSAMIKEDIRNYALQQYEDKIAPFTEQIYPLEKRILLTIIDRMWIDHNDIMSKLRDGINLRSYASSDPLQAYIQEGYQLFDEMMDKISTEMVQYCTKIQIIAKE